MDQKILKCVKFHSAHTAPHDRNQHCYEKALKIVAMGKIDASNVQLSWKTLYDGFNRIIIKRRESARNNALQSGNVETITQFEQDLDSMISEVDHFEERKNKKLEEVTNKQSSRPQECR